MDATESAVVSFSQNVDHPILGVEMETFLAPFLGS